MLRSSCCVPDHRAVFAEVVAAERLCLDGEGLAAAEGEQHLQGRLEVAAAVDQQVHPLPDDRHESQADRLCGGLRAEDRIHLPEPHRQLVRERYADDKSVTDIADERGTTALAARQMFFRIRLALLRCMQAEIRAGAK